MASHGMAWIKNPGSKPHPILLNIPKRILSLERKMWEKDEKERQNEKQYPFSFSLLYIIISLKNIEISKFYLNGFKETQNISKRQKCHDWEGYFSLSFYTLGLVFTKYKYNLFKCVKIVITCNTQHLTRHKFILQSQQTEVTMKKNPRGMSTIRKNKQNLVNFF